ncbi:hypothetical protein BU15DRAFT_76401 [Melanogaster broomeanus]|nr:hypothetical protein BU15DRAFT_76401 [Melanogaster broomeanus]
MKDFPTDISVNAASCALRRGDVPRALELLEQGQAILWTQIARFRTPSMIFALVTRAQRRWSRNLGTSVPPWIDRDGLLKGLVDDWNGVVEELRTFDGFSRFLLPPLFSELQEAACEGLVIVLIASRFSCDVIIVLHKQPPVHIQLEITLEQLSQLAETHQGNISLRRPHYRVFVDVLGELWRKCISPVVAELEKIITKRSRIWWCPTALFTAFPLHAAAEYREGEILLLRRYISSYTEATPRPSRHLYYRHHFPSPSTFEFTR